MAEQEKLQIVIEALRHNPNLTESEIAKLLGFQRPASARFWKIKAQQIIQQSQRK